MNWVDIAVLVVWGLMALWGLKSGLIGMLVPLVVLILGLALSSRIAEPVGNLFSFLSDNESIQTVIAFVAIFIFLLLLSAWLSAMLNAASKVVPLAGPINRIGGVLIGIFVGFLFLSGILTGLQQLPVGQVRGDIAASPLGSFMAEHFGVTIRAVKLVPGDWDEKTRGFQEGFQESALEIKEQVDQIKRDGMDKTEEEFPPH